MSTSVSNSAPGPHCATKSADDEVALVNAIVQRRDRTAFETLFTRYQDRAYSLARNMLRNPALAEEAVQEAFLQVWLSSTVGSEAWNSRDLKSRPH